MAVRNQQPDRRQTDIPLVKLTRLVKVLAIAVVAVVLISGVASAVAVIAAKSAESTAKRTRENAATIADLCQLAAEVKSDLGSNVTRTQAFLDSKFAEGNPLTPYIKQVSLPQAIEERDNRQLPPGCVK